MPYVGGVAGHLSLYCYDLCGKYMEQIFLNIHFFFSLLFFGQEYLAKYFMKLHEIFQI